jgi:putative ABC transport system permease protein
MTFLTLSYWDLALAAVLVIVNAGLSIGLGLGLARPLIIAAVRMVVQLSLIGLVLKALFALTSPFVTGAVALAMVVFAGREATARQTRHLVGGWSFGLGTTAILISSTLVTLVALTAQLEVEPWHDPRYAIPLFGIVLGNTMTGVSLGLERLVSAAASERNAIEAQLALGRSVRVAMRPVVRAAIRAGLIPTVNMMATAGLVYLPGMMTGQILAGVEPLEAVKYQILVLFLITAGTAFGLLASVMGGARRLTDGRHRLRLDRLGNGVNGVAANRREASP